MKGYTDKNIRAYFRPFWHWLPDRVLWFVYDILNSRSSG